METFEHDVLTNLGSEIKMLEGGKVGGYLVRFGSKADTDLQGDFFDETTDFGGSTKSVVLWDHSMDPALGDIELGEVSLKKKDLGIWVEGVLSMRDNYEKFLEDEFGDGGAEKFLKAVRSFIKAQKLGWSSGVPAHRVKRQPIIDDATGKTVAYHIKKWPLGLDASLTPTPAEPRNAVQELKSASETRHINWKSLLAAESEASAEEPPVKGSPTAASEADSREGAGKGLTVKVNVDTSELDDAITKAEKLQSMSPNQQQNKSKTMPEEKENKEPQEQEVKTADTSADIRALTESVKAMQEQLNAQRAVKGQYDVGGKSNTGPAIIKERGDTFPQAFMRWVKTGDRGGLKGYIGFNEEMGQECVEIKASNATDMNIGTAADGGNTVTDDMHGEIIRRADEMSLAARANVRRFRSTANVLDIPIDDEADSEFVVTNEATDFDEDAPAIGQKSLTKLAYTKYVDISYQLQETTSADVMDFIMDRVAIGKAKTDNNLLITEVEANGTEFKVLSGSAIAVDELEVVALNNTNAFYVENPAACRWVMAPATHAAIQVLDDTSIRRYFDNQQGGPRELLGSPILYSNKCEAIGAGNKSVLFGNFNYVGQLEDPGLQFLRDPYTVAIKGQTRLLWYYRTVFGVLQSGAVGYGRHTTS